MKSYISKNSIIGFLIVTNIATVGYTVGSDVIKRRLLKESDATAITKAENQRIQKAKAANSANGSSEKYRQSVVKQTMAEKFPEFEECYNNYLASEPDISEGQLIVSWLIQGNGTVAEPHVAKSDFSSSDLSNCVLGKMNALSFAPPPDKEDVMVAHRINFKHRAPASIEF